jgi:hypothetical protein
VELSSCSAWAMGLTTGVELSSCSAWAMGLTTGVRFPAAFSFRHDSQTGSGASSLVGTVVLSSGVKRPVREADLSPLLPRLGVRGAVSPLLARLHSTRNNFTFALPYRWPENIAGVSYLV